MLEVMSEETVPMWLNENGVDFNKHIDIKQLSAAAKRASFVGEFVPVGFK